MLLPDGKGTTVPFGYTGADFCRDVLDRVPEVIEFADFGFDRVHLLMGDLAAVARQAIPSRNQELLRRLFGVVDEAISRPDADPEIADAAAISFLEPPDFMLAHGNEAWRLVSPKLRWYIEGCH